ncbi:MAG: type IV secretion system DNA-binding domain-containing protein [Candidatus Campbellbacteria bacterium]|nr:type IV secretion system DNA-binding domain-containing protein [Candidatus Campbellbacteria bacterium]
MFDPNRITYIGETDYRNKRVKFGIKAKDRLRHVYTIGKTGTGKSTLLENMAVQDIQNGEGFAFLDPHGKSADLLLDYIPENRINDVVYFAPFDLNNPVAFNVMEDVGPDKRHLVLAGLMSAFKKIWVDAWSARMEYILNNTILALLEYPDSTLLSVNRMLVDKDFRNKVVAHVTDPGVKAFWEQEFAKYTDKFAAEATPAIQNKVGQFTGNPVIRNIIGQPKSTFNIRDMMDQKKILIINLSKGQVGEDNANLLGSMIITKIYLAAMSRADLRESELNKLPNFYLYVDEFQSFANESFADILSEARKYKLNLTIAHQYIEQMSDEVRAAVFGNVGTLVTFRVGAIDAEYLEKEFSPTFTAEDLVGIGAFKMYLKLMIDGMASAPFSAAGLSPITPPEISYRDVAIGRSRAQFSRPRAIVEDEILKWHQKRFNVADDLKKEKEKEGEKSPQSRPHEEVRAHTQQPTHRSQNQSHNQPQRRFNDTKQASTSIDRETEIRKAVSLSHLQHHEKPREKKPNKGPTPEHLSELRQALSAVTGKASTSTPASIPKPAFAPVSNSEATPPNGGVASQAQKPPEEKPKEQKTNEVPEAVLKKLFEREGGEK